jgi:hypothetical protein
MITEIWHAMPPVVKIATAVYLAVGAGSIVIIFTSNRRP